MGLKKLAKGLKRSVVGDIFNISVGSVFGFAKDILGYAIKQLVDIPKIGDQLNEQGQDYSAEFRNSRVEVKDKVPLAYGETRIWFKVINGYAKWIDSQQVLVSYCVVGRGIYDLLDLNIGNLAVGNFGMQRSLLLLPNQPLPPDFSHPNVYVSPDVGQQEMQAGGIRLIEVGPETVTVTTGTVSAGSSRLTLNNLFDGIFVGATFTIVDGAQAGSYVVQARDGGAEPDWIEITPTIPNGSLTASFNWQAYESDGVTITSPEKDKPAIEFVFSAAPDQISGPAGTLRRFNPGDLVVIQGGANDSNTFTIVTTDGDQVLGVSPAPTPETTTASTIRLLRRRTPATMACPRGERTKKATIVFQYPQGLGFAKGEDPNNRTIEYEIRWRSMDDANNPLEPWQSTIVRDTDRTLNKARYFEHDLVFDDAIRPQISAARITYLPDDSRYVDNAVWIQLRSELEPKPGEDPSNDPNTTRLALMVGVTGQLTELQEQTINGLTRRWLKTYVDGEWTDEQPTRSTQWALADWLVNESDGSIGYEDLNAEEFATRAAASTANFDAVIDAPVQFWQTAQQIADRDFCKPYLDPVSQLFRLARDEASDPVVILAHGFNCALDSLSIDTPTSQTRFGVRAKIIDPLTWQERDDGPVYGDDTDPREVQVFGCKEWDAGYEHAAHDYLDNRLRVITTSAQTTRQEVENVRYFDRAWVVSPLGMGQASEIVSLYGTSLLVRQPLKWQAGAQHYVILQDADGTPTARINATRMSDTQMTLASAPGITLRPYGGPRANLCIFGWDEAPGIRANGPRIAICESGKGNELRQATISLRFDDDRVHAPITEYPIDPRASEGEPTYLALTGLALTYSAGKWTAAVDVNSDATVYEFERKWSGELGWTRVTIGGRNTATIPVDGGGTLQVRARAYADGGIGPYTDPVSAQVGDGSHLAVSLSTYSAYGARPTPSVATPRVYGYAQGGDPGYTYQWIRTSGSSAIVAGTPTASDTVFGASVPAGQTLTAQFILRATDSLGATDDSDPLTVTLTNLSAEDLT